MNATITNESNSDCFNSQLLFPNALSPLGDFLMKFSEQSKFPVSVRSLDNGSRIHDMKIIMHNTASAEVRGFKDGQKIGLSIPEVLEQLKLENSFMEAELKQAEENDLKAIHTRSQSTHTQVTMDPKGFIRIFQRIVTPLSGIKGNPIALCTTSLELTQYSNLLHLFKYYQKYYQLLNSKKETAVDKFFKYLELDQYFIAPLNANELMTLVAMLWDNRHKQVAKTVSMFKEKSCAPKTISNHIESIKSKLKEHVNLYWVVTHLRNYYQSTLPNIMNSL